MKTEDKPYKTKPYDHLEDMETNACSATECTGLVMQPPLSQEEWESYMEVYDFGPPLAENCEQLRKPVDK